MKIENEIKEYLRSLNMKEEEINDILSSSVYLSQTIAVYAHRNQFRVNGDSYVSHPINCLYLYRQMVGISEDDHFCISMDDLEKFDIPFDGVQEVCLLHDVLEDTEVSEEEIASLYNKAGLATYYNLYIKDALIAITHIKSDSYEKYIAKVMQNKTASMAKLMDLIDNSNIMTLNKLTNAEEERTLSYIRYSKMINDKYHFIENANIYRIAFKAEATKRNGQ